ncbi:MAG TPA: hypothetical protein VFN30_03065 [Chitinophagaceae bacterium]|nr:hypothetical protein [Chitinophagaceae bacterium]
MTEVKKRGWKNWLQLSFWIITAVGTMVLLVSAIRSKDNKGCKGIEISITGNDEYFFVDKKEVINIITGNGAKKLIGKRLSDVNIKLMEELLEKNICIKNAELFFDNNGVLQIMVEERVPVARIFTVSGTSFYIDGDSERLPLNENFVARVPVVTSFPVETSNLNKKDSIFLQQVKAVASFILNNESWMAQIEQIDITPDRQLEMIPKLGNHIIRFGNATDVKQKFHQLSVFYRQVLNQFGWNKYNTVDVRFVNQVVATKRGFETETKPDSAQVKTLVDKMMNNDQQMVNDTISSVAFPSPVKSEADKVPGKNLSDSFDLSSRNTTAKRKDTTLPLFNPKSNEKRKPKAVMTRRG